MPIWGRRPTGALRTWVSRLRGRLQLEGGLRTLAGRADVGSRTPSTSPDISALAATPSARAWCILVITATRPSSNGWHTCISHSGRDRSSGVPATGPISSSRPGMPPGAGTSWWKTCCAGSTGAVGDPQRVVQAERRWQDAAAQRWQLASRARISSTSRENSKGSGRLHDRDLEGVHVHGGRLHVEIAGVDPLHPLHPGSVGGRPVHIKHKLECVLVLVSKNKNTF